MEDARVEVRGFRELEAGSLALARKIDDAAEARFLDVARTAAGVVRGRVPHRSGRLAGSVEATATADGARVGIGGGVPYAGWIEFGGTRGRPYVAQGRYLYPTALDAEPLLQAAGVASAQGEIRTMLWPKPT